MSQAIIYKNDSGSISVIHPTPEALADYGIDLIAKKDVPYGKPYKIINAADVPSRENRAQWVVNDSDLTDGVGSEFNTFDALIP